MKKITVIGGGGTGIMMAADLTMKGHDVTLFEMYEHAKKILEIKERGYVEVVGNAINGKAVIRKITTDISKAMANAEYILVSAIAQRQEELINLMIPYLQDGQVVCFSAGNCASIILKNKLKDKKVLVGEMQGNIYPCRMLENGTIISAFSYKEKGLAAFPAKDNNEYIKVMNEIYPCHAVKNVFEATLNSPNTSIHLAGSILGIAKMESMEDFRLYRDGITPSVVATIAAVEEEKALVMKKMDYTMGRAVGQMEAILEHEKHPELNIFIGLEGPSGVKHRYITEDAYVSNSLLLSIAKEFGIRTPIYEGLVAIASAVNHTDFYETGRTLRYFGLTGKKAEEINRYLETGEK